MGPTLTSSSVACAAGPATPALPHCRSSSHIPLPKRTRAHTWKRFIQIKHLNHFKAILFWERALLQAAWCTPPSWLSVGLPAKPTASLEILHWLSSSLVAPVSVERIRLQQRFCWVCCDSPSQLFLHCRIRCSAGVRKLKSPSAQVPSEANKL